MGKLRIREICKKKGVMLIALAKHIHLNQSSFSTALKKESFSINQLDMIASFLGVDIAELFIDLDEIRNGPDYTIFLYKDGELTRFTDVPSLQQYLRKNG